MATHAHSTPAPEPAQPPTRRRVMSAFSGAAFAGTALVIVTPSAASADPDAAFIALCASLEAVQRRINGKWGQGFGAAEYRCVNYDHDESDVRFFEDDPLQPQVDDIITQMGALTAPSSIEGMRALARCVLLVDPEIRASVTTDRRTMHHNPCQTETLLGWLLNTLTDGAITDATCMDAPGYLVGEDDL